MFKGFQTKSKQFNSFPALNFQMNNEAYGFSGCTFWLDAAYGLNTQTNLAAISSWQCKISEIKFIQATAGNQPRYTSSDLNLNSYPAIDFYDTNRNFAANNNIVMSRLSTIAFVGYVYALSTNYNVILLNDSIPSHYITMGGNASLVTGIGIYNGTSSTVLATNIEDTLPHIVIFTSTEIIVDGVSQVSGTVNFPVSYNRLSGGATGAFYGKMAELLIYKQSLDVNEAIELSDRLNSKYAIY